MYSVLTPNTPNTLSLPRDCILSVTENKMQMNTMLYKSQPVPEFLKLTEGFENKLTLVGVEDHPIEIYKGTVIRRRDVISKLEEADLDVAQQAVYKIRMSPPLLMIHSQTSLLYCYTFMISTTVHMLCI